MSGTANRERTYVFVVFNNRFVGELAHQIAHHGLEVADGASLSFERNAAILVHHGIILAVIVPDRLAAILQKCVRHVLLPAFPVLLTREINKVSLAAPPGSNSRLFFRAVLYEHTLFFHFMKKRVYQQHSRFDVRRDDNPSLFHLRKPVRRIFKAIIVPGEGAALNPFLCLDCTISGRKLKSVGRNVLFSCCIDKLKNSLIRVLGKLRIIHGGAKISKCRFRKQHRFSRKIRIPFYNILNGRACNQEKVHISCICAERGIAVPVIAFFPAHVKRAFCCCVIKIANCLLRLSLQLDVKRNMLV